MILISSDILLPVEVILGLKNPTEVILRSKKKLTESEQQSGIRLSLP